MFLKAVDKSLLQLIKKISTFPEISESFYLAGGTALALHLGHRKSVDLDLFCRKKFDEKNISNILQNIGGEISSTYSQTVHGVVDNAKVSFIRFNYKMLFPFEKKIEKIQLASLADIAAMKIMAVSHRAEKKDFYDMYEILKTFPVSELKKHLMEKYDGKVNCYHILRSFFYFDDAEDSADPVSLNKTKWKDVKNYFLKNEKTLMRELVC